MNCGRASVSNKLCDRLTQFLQFLGAVLLLNATCAACTGDISGNLESFLASRGWWYLHPCEILFGKTVVWPVCIMAADTGLHCFDCFVQCLLFSWHTPTVQTGMSEGNYLQWNQWGLHGKSLCSAFKGQVCLQAAIKENFQDIYLY